MRARTPPPGGGWQLDTHTHAHPRHCRCPDLVRHVVGRAWASGGPHRTTAAAVAVAASRLPRTPPGSVAVHVTVAVAVTVTVAVAVTVTVAVAVTISIAVVPIAALLALQLQLLANLGLATLPQWLAHTAILSDSSVRVLTLHAEQLRDLWWRKAAGGGGRCEGKAGRVGWHKQQQLVVVGGGRVASGGPLRTAYKAPSQGKQEERCSASAVVNRAGVGGGRGDARLTWFCSFHGLRSNLTKYESMGTESPYRP